MGFYADVNVVFGYHCDQDIAPFLFAEGSSHLHGLCEESDLDCVTEVEQPLLPFCLALIAFLLKADRVGAPPNFYVHCPLSDTTERY